MQNLKKKGEQAFIPERYVNMLELLVEVPLFGRGILIHSADLSSYIKLGRIHANVILNREVVYITEQSALTPIALLK